LFADLASRDRGPIPAASAVGRRPAPTPRHRSAWRHGGKRHCERPCV